MFEVILVSSDTSSRDDQRKISDLKAGGHHIVCDITAMAPQSSRGDIAWSDGEIQAMTGLMDTTGFPDGDPVRMGVPFSEISAAFYAGSAVAVALGVTRTRGIRQTIDVSLFGCAISGLTTFLPKAFVRGVAERIGNRHTACAPWNSYRTSDGWVLVCTSTDDHWARLRGAIGTRDFEDPRFDRLASRVMLVAELDRLVEGWTSSRSTLECLAICESIGIPAGPIVQVRQLGEESNFRLRHPVAARALAQGPVPREAYRDVATFRVHPLSGPLPARSSLGEAAKESPGLGYAVPELEARRGPLAGLKVVEIGQYTTAPLAGKHLAALGAEVIKIEPPEGEVARRWTPGQSGVSYFFALNNTDKTILKLDLRQNEQRDRLRGLIAEADILVENLRPGALAKLGFDRASLERINPRLIYCAISGFGTESTYPDRPAFDTVIQGMAGLMDLTRGNGVPVKLGVSAADILGGQAALLAIVAALAGGKAMKPRFLEIAMQDVAAWCAIFAAGRPVVKGLRLACRDGFVWLDKGSEPAGATPIFHACDALTRTQAIERLAGMGLRAVSIARVDELMEDADFLGDVLAAGTDENGAFWPVVKLPYRLHRTPGRVAAIAGVDRT
ncbi:MAG: dehydratase [Bradyrhizobium sp.]|nr:dehydratase [Bradyrhizobium sp.]